MTELTWVGTCLTCKKDLIRADKPNYVIEMFNIHHRNNNDPDIKHIVKLRPSRRTKQKDEPGQRIAEKMFVWSADTNETREIPIPMTMKKLYRRSEAVIINTNQFTPDENDMQVLKKDLIDDIDHPEYDSVERDR